MKNNPYSWGGGGVFGVGICEEDRRTYPLEHRVKQGRVDIGRCLWATKSPTKWASLQRSPDSDFSGFYFSLRLNAHTLYFSLYARVSYGGYLCECMCVWKIQFAPNMMYGQGCVYVCLGVCVCGTPRARFSRKHESNGAQQNEN